MIRCLASGPLVTAPETRVAASGAQYTTARIRSGDGDDAVLVSIIGFRDEADALSQFVKGDAISVSGRTKLTAWTGKDGVERRGLQITAEQVIGAKARRGSKMPSGKSHPKPDYVAAR